MEVGDEPLRLNSEPVPADAMPLAIGDHAARVAAAIAWLDEPVRRLCAAAAAVHRQRISASSRRRSRRIGTELAERVKPYDGLYAPEDFLWSALRPLPRGWVPAADRLLPADMVFWDGTQAIAIELGARETEKQKALQAAGIAVCRIEPSVLAGDPMLLGQDCRKTSSASGKARRCRPARSAGLSRAVALRAERES